MVCVPDGVTLSDDYTFAVPREWENDPAWYCRNDMQFLCEHNMAVQLAQATLIESAEGE
jgi:hypothetical protein